MAAAAEGRSAPLVTVAISTFNRAHLVGRAIRCALAQTVEDIEVTVQAKEGYAAAGDETAVVVLSTELTEALLEEGKYRELLNRIQTFRKDLGLEYTQRIRLAIRGSESLKRLVEARRDDLMKETLCVDLTAKLEGHTREVDIEGEPATIILANA